MACTIPLRIEFRSGEHGKGWRPEKRQTFENNSSNICNEELEGWFSNEECVILRRERKEGICLGSPTQSQARAGYPLNQKSSGQNSMILQW